MAGFAPGLIVENRAWSVGAWLPPPARRAWSDLLYFHQFTHSPFFASPGSHLFRHLEIAAEGVRQLDLPRRPALRFEYPR